MFAFLSSQKSFSGDAVLTTTYADDYIVRGQAFQVQKRIALGNQVFPIAAAIGAQATRIDVNLDAPVVVNSGEFVHVILKMPLGTATASQIIRGVVGFNGYFE